MPSPKARAPSPTHTRIAVLTKGRLSRPVCLSFIATPFAGIASGLLPLKGEDPEAAVLAYEHDPARRAVGEGPDDDAGTLMRGLADPELDLPAPDEGDAHHRGAGPPVAEGVRLVEAARKQPAGGVVAALVLRAEEL